MTAKLIRQSTVRDIVILAVAVLILTLPFVNQAFHWDDRDFIEMAKTLADDPARFHLTDYSGRGAFNEVFPFRHPPLLPYYMSLFVRLGGESEILLHAAFVLFPLIAAASMYSLARRFTRRPLMASLLLLFTPGFMVMSHTVMGNLPGVSLWLAATALFVWGVDRDDWWLLVAAGFAAAASIMIFAQGLSLFGILPLYALLKWRFRLRVLVAIAIPAVIYASWRFYIGNRYGHPPAISYRVDFHAGTQLRSLLVFLGGSIIFPLSFWVVFLRRRIDLLVGFALIPPLVAWVAIYYVAKGDLSLWQGIQVAVLAVAGFLIVYGLLLNAVREGVELIRKRSNSIDAIFLLGWFFGVAVIYAGTTSLPYVAVRHLLPLFAPVVILFVREAEGIWPQAARARETFIALTLMLTLLGGLAVSIADYRLAGIYRDAAADLASRYADNPSGKWALGEFGFRYYMEKAGFQYLSINSAARPGDIVVSSYISSTGVVAPLPEGFYRTLSVGTVDDKYPVRSMDSWAGAGFYGNLMGPLPFTFSSARLDEISVNELFWETGSADTDAGNG